MKILICLFFAICCFMLIFFLNSGMSKKQGILLYGVSLVALPVLAVAVMLTMKISHIQPGHDFKFFFFAILMSLTTLVMINLIILAADFILSGLIGFQEKYNSEKLNRKPVSFAIKNQSHIMLFYRILFFLGSCLMFYGIWFDKKP